MIWTIVWLIIIGAAFITGGATQGVLAIFGMLGFAILFEWFGLWD